VSKEDYTAYTETDPNSRYTVTVNNIDVAGLLRNEDAWVVDDKGINHFDADFEHLVDAEFLSGTSGGLVTAWMVADAINDINGLLSDAGESYLAVWGTAVGAVPVIRVIEVVGTSLYFDSYIVSYNTPYYLRIKRDESIGTYGQIQCFIYSDSARTILVYTLVLALHAKNDFRYIYGVNSGNKGTTESITATISNLDLQEAVSAFQILRRRIEGY
jgi:hypothetical protein